MDSLTPWVLQDKVVDLIIILLVVELEVEMIQEVHLVADDRDWETASSSSRSYTS